jgi:hypothetical protein
MGSMPHSYGISLVLLGFEGRTSFASSSVIGNSDPTMAMKIKIGT